MFETTFPDTAHHGADFKPVADGELRAFDWAELCARIAATGELRRVMVAARRDGGFESFASSLNVDAQNRPDEPEPNSKRAVNRDFSRNGKALNANDADISNARPQQASPSIAGHGDRKAP